MLRLPTQALHRLHQRTRVPDLDLLGPDPRLQPLPDQTRRHRIGVLLHLDRAPLAHVDPLPLPRLQSPGRQRPQPRFLLDKLLPAPGVPPGHQGTHEVPVFFPAGEVPAAPQQQLLQQRLLETPMTLLTITVLMAAVGIGCFGRHPVVVQQPLIPSRVVLRLAVVMHRQGHPVRAMSRGHPSQFPQGVLQTGAQARETLRKTEGHALPIREGQHKVIEQVGKRLALDGHAQTVQVREVRRTQPPRFMHLAKEHFLGQPVLCFPLSHAPFQRTTLPLPVLTRMLALQPVYQRLGLQSRLTLKQVLQGRPDFHQGIGTRPPVMRAAGLAGQLPQVAILPCGFGIHACFHRCQLQRPSLVQVPANFLHLGIRYLASRSHWQLLCPWNCQCRRRQLIG
jgi:hypothetical protein